VTTSEIGVTESLPAGARGFFRVPTQVAFEIVDSEARPFPIKQILIIPWMLQRQNITQTGSIIWYFEENITVCFMGAGKVLSLVIDGIPVNINNFQIFIEGN